jgi:capsular polysaccharide transport system permease protein
LVVLLPALLAAAFLFGVMADQYESEAMFTVRGVQQDSARVSGLGDLLGAAGSIGTGQAEARSVGHYLRSAEALSDLKAKGLDLPALFRRPEADVASRLWFESPEAETLLRYYRGQVDILFNPEDGVTRLRVRAFRPADALALNQALLTLAETKINSFNDRALDAVMRNALGDVDVAERDLTAAQQALTRFRQGTRDIDPRLNIEGTASISAELEAQILRVRAQLQSARASLAPGSPQLQALQARLSALEAQQSGLRSRLAGSSGSLAPRLAGYEELQLRQQFAAKRYEAARTGLELARAQALKQRLFVVMVVTPNLPEKSLYPERFTLLGATLVALLLVYGIGWLLLAGVREHTA